MDMNTNYSKLSYTLTKQISKTDKKEQGIYFTPPTTIQKTLELLKPYIIQLIHQDNFTVLEPSCGSSEYILAFHQLYPLVKITGIEKNETIFDAIKQFDNESIEILNKDYLEYDSQHTYNLILGNPPYFVMKKGDVDKSYYNYFEGRPNIFILFIVKSLSQLKKNGILSFVLPKNFLNCSYYNKLREYIYNNYTILNILECDDDYIETKQDTILLIIQNIQPINTNTSINDNWTLKRNDYLVFGMTEKIEKICELYSNSTTLSELGFNVKVGNVVWNQVKPILTTDSTKTRLIYNSDIVNSELTIKTYNNTSKKNYIDKEGITGPLLVINRGYGKGNYIFEYCLINEDGFEYLIENHLICIFYNKKVSDDELVLLYKKIICSLCNDKTKQFINLYFGNNAINTTELNNILPIYV